MEYSLHKLGIEVLNPMQEEMLRIFPRESSLVLLSPTGTGKTLAYLLPLLQRLDAASDELQALVLVPSRELAQQTDAVARQLSPELRSFACYGGRPAMEEHRLLRAQRPHLVIGTPGRLFDHIRKQNFEVSHIRQLIIDEFDKCLELGFREQIQAVVAELGGVERRFLLSATDSDEIPSFVGSRFHKLNFLDDDGQPSDRVNLFQVDSPEKDKLRILFDLLCTLGQTTSLIFVNYRESVERVGDYLRRMGMACDTFHGGMEQRDRERALFRFSNGSANILVSTDLASRGLNITGIQNIIHYHLPLNEEAFVHRNGRTARWDAQGNAYIILGPEERLPEYITEAVERWQRPVRIPAPQQPRWVTLYIGKGRRDKINKVDIVGFLSKVGGLGREQLGRIDVLPDWAFAAVERSAVREVLQRVKNQKIKGVKTLIQLAEK